MNYLDLFSGAGGLSEGFMRAGFNPIAHIDVDKAACNTLKTRMVYKQLQKEGKSQLYWDYLSGNIRREDFYRLVSERVTESVLNENICKDNILAIFDKIDSLCTQTSVDLVIGGPPCQAYSIAGRSRDKNNMIGDHRNYLYIMYAEFLRRYKPRYFVFENVIGLLSAKDHDGILHFKKMKDLFNECGYSIDYRVLNAHDYGIFQNRKRVILIGRYGDWGNFFPNIPKQNLNHMVSSIFEDLPSIKSGCGSARKLSTLNITNEYLIESGIKKEGNNATTLHWARPNKKQDLEIYRIAVELWKNDQTRLRYVDLPSYLKSQKNVDSFLDRYKVVASNINYSQTVVAHIAKDGHYFIHPDIEQNRSLTPREAARLQTFPDDYYFESVSGDPSRTTAFKQIGNAVPVLLAEKIALALLEDWL